MKTLMFLLLLGICFYGGEAVIHSLKYFYTGSTELPNFPEFAAVGMVDDQQFEYYDSITGRAQVKLDWLVKYIADKDPQYLDRHTQIFMGTQPNYKPNIEILKTRFNQTGGAHIVQKMYGCEWDDQTDEVGGYRQYGFDGEDFLVWNVKTNTWIAAKQQGFITATRWNNDKAELEYRKNYLSQECVEWLKKYVNYGRSSLMKTVLPSVSLLQKSSSSPIICHATGFYPNRVEMVWRKDGEELHEGVDKKEILPNDDGTFQMSVHLKLSSVTPEEWERYDCVFQLSGEKDIMTKLEKAMIKINKGSSGINASAVAGGVIGGLLLLALITAVIYFTCIKKGNNGFKRANTFDTSSSSSEGSNTKKEPSDNPPA